MRVLTPPYLRFACSLSVASLLLSAGCSSDSSGPQGSGGTGASSGAAVTGGVATGGTSVTTGGSATGGVATGGAATGGSPTATGGASTGGNGGTLATGGAAVTTGGKTSTGGAGGASAGTTSTGGSAAAGANATGGSGGKAGTGGATSAGATSTGGATSGAFTITSPGWMNMAGCAANMTASCADLPKEITRSGAGTSPELHWAGAPAGTKSFAVVLQDLSGGSTHWVIWNIPATTTMLPANIDRTTAMPATPAGSQQCGKGTDAATKFGYVGPGAPCNVYEFMVYALSSSPFSPTSTTDPAMVRTQLNGLDASTLLGTAALRGRTNMTCN
jgi:Raf kinase inhibitor-like YbhB/YbcL family protein